MLTFDLLRNQYAPTTWNDRRCGRWRCWQPSSSSPSSSLSISSCISWRRLWKWNACIPSTKSWSSSLPSPSSPSWPRFEGKERRDLLMGLSVLQPLACHLSLTGNRKKDKNDTEVDGNHTSFKTAYRLFMLCCVRDCLMHLFEFFSRKWIDVFFSFRNNGPL